MRFDRLTPLERMMLQVSATWPQDVGALVVLDGTALFDLGGTLRMDAIRTAIEARLHQVPRFRQVIHVPRRGLGGPLWVDPDHFDINRHVRERPLQPSSTESESLEAIEAIRRQPLDPTRPMWEMWFLTGLPDRKVALFARIHHSIADGMAAMTAVASFLDTTPDAPLAASPRWTPRPRPSNRELLLDNLTRGWLSLSGVVPTVVRPRMLVRRIREIGPPLRRLIAERPATKTSLSRMVGDRRHARLVRADLDAVKVAARSHDATVNDVLLTVTAGGVRALLQSRNESVEHVTIRAYAPISLRRERDVPQQGNQIAQMAIPLALREADPSRRLRVVAAETKRRKALARTSLDVLVQNRFLKRFTLMAALRLRVNVATANIPGPPMPLYLAGARLLEVFPLIPLVADEPLGVGALSYAGQLFIGIVADAAACPDIDVFVDGLRYQVRNLQLRLPDDQLPASLEQEIF